MRRVGKQIVAITLAAAMMGSLTPEACTFLQNEVVYAAETENQVWIFILQLTSAIIQTIF